jgi:hypothetical protein
VAGFRHRALFGASLALCAGCATLMAWHLFPGAPVARPRALFLLWWAAGAVFLLALVPFALADRAAGLSADPARRSRALWSAPRRLRWAAWALLGWFAVGLLAGPRPALGELHASNGRYWHESWDPDDSPTPLSAGEYRAQRRAQARLLAAVPAGCSMVTALMVAGTARSRALTGEVTREGRAAGETGEDPPGTAAGR